MVTIEQISKISKCSTSTVSKALNGYTDISEKTRERIVKIANELGYVPNATAQSLVRRKSNTIGLVYEVEYGLKNLFFASILESFRKNIEKKGYDIILLSNNTDSGMDYLRHCRSKHVDGVLVVSMGTDREALQKLRDSEIAVLTLDPEQDINNSIYSDSYVSIKKSCQYLYDLGHRDIAFIQGDQTNFVGKSRLDSYLDFIKEHNLEKKYIDYIVNIGYSFDDGFNTMRAIHNEIGIPTAVCASSDTMALGAISYLQEQGYNVPNDVSVIGFDDIQLCEMIQPKLTTIRQNYEEIGQKACEALLDMVEKKDRDIAPIKVETELVVRESCKAIK